MILTIWRFEVVKPWGRVTIFCFVFKKVYLVPSSMHADIIIERTHIIQLAVKNAQHDIIDYLLLRKILTINSNFAHKIG